MAKRGFNGVLMRATHAREHIATVISKEAITPHFVRVHLHSDTLFEDAELAPTAWLRGWFPDHEGKEAEHQRGYTISSGDPESGRFSLDFVLHEPAGPASAWAQRCRPGDTLPMSSLGSSKFELPEEPPAGYLLVGDAAALPGLAGIIGALPPEIPVELYLEEHHADDRMIPIPSHPRLRTHWVPRTGPGSLAQAIEARDWSNWHAWATPESASLKQLRTRLRDDFGFPRSEIHAQAYWVEGKAMGKQRGGEAPAAAGEGSAAAEAPAAAGAPRPPGPPQRPGHPRSPGKRRERTRPLRRRGIPALPRRPRRGTPRPRPRKRRRRPRARRRGSSPPAASGGPPRARACWRRSSPSSSRRARCRRSSR